MTRPRLSNSLLVLALASTALLPRPVTGQVEADPPVVRGVVMEGDGPLAGQEVTLHRVGPDEAGEIDSALAGPDGAFSFELPSVPGGTDEVFFVSTRYRGILYFGAAVTDVAALDSIHTIQVYDTLAAPPGGYDFTVANRNVFVEEVEGGLQITDVFGLANPGDRTVISGADGITWSYPLMTGAHSVELGDGDLGPDVFDFSAGRVITQAPVPPGERLYVFRYQIPELVRLPLPGTTTRLELLVREPASAFAVEGLRTEQPVALEPGSNFRRYTGDNLEETAVTFGPAAASEGIPLQWLMVGLALALGLLGVWAVTRQRHVQPTASRATVLLKVARLDEEFESIEEPSSAERKRYQKRRDALLRQLPTSGS